MDKSSYVVLAAFVLVVAGVFYFAGGGGATPSPTPSPTEQASGNLIQVLDGSFSPSTIEIEVGEEVTWVNAGSQPRVLYFADLESPVIEPGEEFTRSFEAAAEYEYLGEPWSDNFKGTVLVVTE